MRNELEPLADKLLCSMSADQDIRNDARVYEFRCDGRHLLPPNHDSPRHSLPDVYCQQCNCATAEAVSPAVYGIDYLRYWDCCGTSTVSIESKIEQALDLVKNHLMFAVREEVRALSEEIQDLVTKNEQLEYENRVLRSSATPEALTRMHKLLSQLSDRNTFAS